MDLGRRAFSAAIAVGLGSCTIGSAASLFGARIETAISSFWLFGLVFAATLQLSPNALPHH